MASIRSISTKLLFVALAATGYSSGYFIGPHTVNLSPTLVCDNPLDLEWGYLAGDDIDFEGSAMGAPCIYNRTTGVMYAWDQCAFDSIYQLNSGQIPDTFPDVRTISELLNPVDNSWFKYVPSASGGGFIIEATSSSASQDPYNEDHDAEALAQLIEGNLRDGHIVRLVDPNGHEEYRLPAEYSGWAVSHFVDWGNRGIMYVSSTDSDPIIAGTITWHVNVIIH